jgi:hypothetical protein
VPALGLNQGVLVVAVGVPVAADHGAACCLCTQVAEDSRQQIADELEAVSDST